ncbi:MAG: LysR family transcriptional regulator [Verrucomicrobiia bacterium]
MFEKLFAHSGLSLDRLRAFAEIVKAGGITAAARDDSNRQSQLSRQLKELERYFGAELIRRGRGPMKLTEAGQRLFRIIGHAFGAFEEFREACTDQPVELVIGAGESLIQWLLLPRLRQLTAGQPRINMTLENLRTDEIILKLADGNIDFGVVSRLKRNHQLASVPLGRFDYALFLPPGLAATGRRLRFPSQILSGLPLATLEGSPAIRQALEEEAHKRQIKLDVRLRLSSYPQLAQAMRHLNVAAIMPTLAAQSLSADSFRLLHLPFLDALSRRICLAWNKSLVEVRPAIERYSGLLAAILRQPSAQ